MKRRILFATAVLICYGCAYAQKAKDVLENGIHIKAGEKLYLHLENNKLQYDVALSPYNPANTPNPMPLEDNTIFLVTGQGLNVYVAPVNPLNYAYSTKTEEITDPIDEAAATATADFIKMFRTIETSSGENRSLEDPICVGNAKAIESNLTKAYELLEQDKKQEIGSIFKELKALNFNDERATSDKLAKINEKKAALEDYFTTIATRLASAEKQLATFREDCKDEADYFMRNFVYTQALRYAETVLAEQKKRLKNLQAIYDLVEKAQQEASNGVDGVKWMTKLDLVPSREGKMQLYIVTIVNPGYKLNDAGEIAKEESKELQKVSVKMLKFKRFVPEVSAGIAYTLYKYNTYTATADNFGVLRVSEPVQNEARRINITSMVNWVYYCPNSHVRPLFQLGLGINAGIPTLVAGAGLRFNAGQQRIAITGGAAFTWLRGLNELSIGKQVTGQADIEKDLKFQFAWPINGYIGLQYYF